MSFPPGPLSALDDNTLWDAQLELAILCHRSHWSLKKHRRKSICSLGEALEVEAQLRGVSSPQAPFHIGDIRAKPGSI